MSNKRSFCSPNSIHNPQKMSLQKFLQNLKTVKKCQLPKPSQDPSHKATETIFSTALNTSLASQTVPITTTLLDLTPSMVHLILSNPNLKTPKCLDFFNFLIKNQSLISFKIDLQAHLTLVFRLIKARKFSDAENVLNSLSNDENLRYPFSVIASFIDSQSYETKMVAKLLNLMLKVYSDSRKFEEASETFDYMKNNGIEINERTCTVHLIALVRNDQVGLGLEFFYRMLESGIEVSVFSLTAVVGGLCKCGEIKRARELVDEMASRGIKPNIITCNTLVDACAKRWNFGELDLILVLMEREGVEFNVETYKFLIDGFSSSGKIEETEKMVTEMHSRSLKVDTYLYNVVINGYCRLGDLESAFLVIGKMTERGIGPNTETYWTLVSGLCRTGQMEEAKELVDEMVNKGIEMDQVMFNTLIDGYIKKRMIGEAYELKVEMEKKGFFVDVYACDVIASWLCELGRTEEAKWLLNTMVKRGVNPNTLSFTPLLDSVEFSVSREVFPRDRKRVDSHNIDSYSDVINEYCESRDMRNDLKLYDKIQDLEYITDI